MLRATPVGACILDAAKIDRYQCFVVNTGASEQIAGGGRSESYSDFEDLLCQAGLAHLQRLDPPWMWGLTFDEFSTCSDEESDALMERITEVLFPDPMAMFLGSQDLDSPRGLKVVNKICDFLTMWSHIQYGNDVFCTSDKNFLKASRKQALLDLGAKRICTPAEL